MFDPVLEEISKIAADAWMFLVGLLVIVAVLGALWYVLQGATGVAFGGSGMTSKAIIVAIGLVILVIVAFLILPEMSSLLEGLKPEPPF